MYKLITTPVFASRSFIDFTKNEAEAYLSWFLQNRLQRLIILENYVQKDFPFWKLDYNVTSFVELFNWFGTVISYRQMTEIEKSEMTHQLNSSELLASVIPIPEQTFTDQTISICFDLGILFGELLIKQNNLLNWKYKVSSKKYIYYAQPIITREGIKVDFNPRAIMEITAGKVLDEIANKNEFENLFKIWSDILN